MQCNFDIEHLIVKKAFKKIGPFQLALQICACQHAPMYFGRGNVIFSSLVFGQVC